MSNKRYIYGDKTMTREEAIAWAPSPQFFDRASEKMRKSNLEEILMRNIQEIRFWLNQWEMAATGRVAGRVTKRTLVIDANRLHDWRAGMNIMSGLAGRPYLWEVAPNSNYVPAMDRGHPDTATSEMARLIDRIATLSRQIQAQRELLTDIKAWDVDQYLVIPLELRVRIQTALSGGDDNA